MLRVRWGWGCSGVQGVNLNGEPRVVTTGAERDNFKDSEPGLFGCLRKRKKFVQSALGSAGPQKNVTILDLPS